MTFFNENNRSVEGKIYRTRDGEKVTNLSAESDREGKVFLYGKVSEYANIWHKNGKSIDGMEELDIIGEWEEKEKELELKGFYKYEPSQKYLQLIDHIAARQILKKLSELEKNKEMNLLMEKLAKNPKPAVFVVDDPGYNPNSKISEVLSKRCAPKPDADGWYTHDGKSWPCVGLNETVEIIYDDQQPRPAPCIAGVVRWGYITDIGYRNIIKYRLHKPDHVGSANKMVKIDLAKFNKLKNIITKCSRMASMFTPGETDEQLTKALKLIKEIESDT